MSKKPEKAYLQFEFSWLSTSFFEQFEFWGPAVQTLCNVNGSESFGSNTTFGGKPTVPVDIGAFGTFWPQVIPSQHWFLALSFVDWQTAFILSLRDQKILIFILLGLVLFYTTETNYLLTNFWILK